ncbi:MAG TPA: cytochrome c oxidase subunit II [Acidimicrobiales bacterium]|nr:cytochrome c oxidase subunit II [Acidimicrobiales bacterium]
MKVSRRTRRLLPLALLLGALSSACAKGAPQDTLEPVGPIAKQLDGLFNPVVAVAAVFFFLVQGLVLFCALRFRRKSEDEAPKQIHGNVKLEITWTAIPALILAIVGVATVVTIWDINKVDKSAEVLDVTVTGHQWWWEYEYPELGLVTANELHIPTGTRVELKLQSDDVIHSFWPPKLAGKVDVIPGHENHMAIEADEPGEFEGQCTEFCGLSHSRMRLRVIAQTPEDFRAWAENQKREHPAPGPGGTGEVAEGAALFQSRGCGGCHTVEGYTEGQIGPNLTHLFDRETFAGAIFELNSLNLRRWLRDPQEAKAGNKMVLPVPLNEDEITKLIAYLETLK